MLIPRGLGVLTSAFHSALLPLALGPFTRRHWKLSLQVCVKCPTTASIQEGADALTAWEAWPGCTWARTPQQEGPALAAAVPRLWMVPVQLPVMRWPAQRALPAPKRNLSARAPKTRQTSNHTHAQTRLTETQQCCLERAQTKRSIRAGRAELPCSLQFSIEMWCLTLILVKISLWEEKRSLQNHSEGSMQTFTVKLRTGNKSSLLQMFQGAGGAGMAHRPGTELQHPSV